MRAIQSQSVRHDKPENNDGGNEETQELGLHVEPVVALHMHLVARPVRENTLVQFENGMATYISIHYKANEY
jgi:hypothetical protein